MIPANASFDGTFPFAPHFSDAPGFRMHYVDEGAGEPMVLLHGEPTGATSTATSFPRWQSLTG